MNRQVLTLNKGINLTNIPTNTIHISPIIMRGGAIMDNSRYDFTVDDNGFIRIQNNDLPVGEYEVFRNTLLKTSWASDNQQGISNLDTIYQYLEDHRNLDLTSFADNTLSNKFLYELQDKHLSMQDFTPMKLKRNPAFGKSLPLTGVNKNLYFEYIIDMDDMPELTQDVFTGLSFYRGQYTPIKNLSIIDGNIWIDMYKYMYDPKKEDFTKPIYEIKPNNIKLYLNGRVFNAGLARESAFSFTIYRQTSRRNAQGLLAITFDDVFVPLKIYYTPKRDLSRVQLETDALVQEEQTQTEPPVEIPTAPLPVDDENTQVTFALQDGVYRATSFSRTSEFISDLSYDNGKYQLVINNVMLNTSSPITLLIGNNVYELEWISFGANDTTIYETKGMIPADDQVTASSLVKTMNIQTAVAFPVHINGYNSVGRHGSSTRIGSPSGNNYIVKYQLVDFQGVGYNIKKDTYTVQVTGPIPTHIMILGRLFPLTFLVNSGNYYTTPVIDSAEFRLSRFGFNLRFDIATYIGNTVNKLF